MDAVLTPITIFAITLVGYIFKRVGIFSNRDYKILQSIVFTLTIPGAIIHSFATTDHDVSLLILTLFGLVCALIPLPIVFFATRRFPAGERAFMMLNSNGYNIGNFAFPVLSSFFGPSAIVAAAMFDMGNVAVISGASSVLIRSALHIAPDKPLSEQDTAEGAPVLPHVKLTDPHAKRLAFKNNIFSMLKSLFSSLSFDIYLLMIVLMLFHITMPGWVATVTEPLANANSFCSMLMVGMLMELPANRKDVLAVTRVIGWRIVFSIIFAVAAWFLLPVGPTIRTIAVMICFCPSAVFSTLFTDKVLGNAKLAGFTLATTVIISLIVLTCLNFAF